MAGNGLAVVHDADDVDEATMLAFARETKLSETSFIQSGDGACDYRNRIWMLTGELPMAGHPSLGAAVAVAYRQGQASASYVQRTPAGLQPVEVQLDGRTATASMVQEAEQFLGELDPAIVLASIGLTPDDADQELPAELVATGVPQVLVPVSGPEALSRAKPDAAKVAALLAETTAITVYAAFCDTANGWASARSFFDSPGGIAEEDPATGSAAGPLMAYLHKHRGLTALVIEQGVQMGRPSRLEASMEGDRPRVGGEVVVLSEGTLHL